MLAFAIRAARRASGRALFVGSGLSARAFASAPWDEAGLLKGATDGFYAPTLDLIESKNLVELPGMLYSAAQADMAAGGQGGSVDDYLQRVNGAAAGFIRRRELHDRHVIMASLRNLVRAEGRLALLLGGKSVGKTFILGKLAEELLKTDPRVQTCSENAVSQDNSDSSKMVASLRAQPAKLQGQVDALRPRRVIVYNARHHGVDLVAGLIEAFSNMASAAATMVGVDAEAAAKVARGITGVKLEDVLEDIVKVCEDEGVFPCLVVDEANVALVADDKEKKERTLEVLRLLTEYTKEKGRMNVILASSEYSEPYRLSALGFKSDHFTTQVLVPEVPPKDMRELLQGKWGMGPNLATACLAVWGGHVWAAAIGVDMLAQHKQAFTAIDNKVAFSNDALRGAVYCADAESDLNLAGMSNMLEAIARHGYAPFRKENDPRVELISKRNVGGVIARGTTAPGVPAEAWQGNHDSLLVATNQAMRMLLSRHLK